ncbi:MAG: hypothetical protein J7K61_06545 [Thermoplasmata archaeon]|nr:hypothetical protein [Thermoplasmata archaeon]
MQYPVIKIKGGKIMYHNEISRGKKAAELLKNLTKNGIVYVFDIDGYRKNSVNFELYMKAGKNLWIDAYPRSAEDVMDLIISGAEKITLRDMNEDVLKEVKEMVEKDVYLSGKDVREEIKKARKMGFKGVVLYDNQDSKEEDMEIWKIYENQYIIKRIK